MKAMLGEQAQSGRRLVAVDGDFALASLAMRLLAPNPEALLRHMPEAREETSLERWETYSAQHNWHDEAQSVRYVGNFVHEFVHLLQHTTLPQCMGQVDMIHDLTAATWSAISELKDGGDGRWPPRVPLFPWLREVAPDAFEYLSKQWLTYDGYSRLYLGDEDFAAHFCRTLGVSQAQHFAVPYNPRIGELNRASSWEPDGVNDIPITTTMLLESQATAIEYRFLWSFFGEKIASGLMNMAAGGGIRKDYDLLVLLSLSDGLLMLMPILVDWAFAGTAYIPLDGSETRRDFKSLHPPWRFARLYESAIALFSGSAGADSVLDAIKEPDDLRARLLRRAELHDDPDGWIGEWLSGRSDAPHTKVLRINGLNRIQHAAAYALPEANLVPIQSWTCTPSVVFRDERYINYHPGVRLSDLDQVRLHNHAQFAFELNRMIQGFVPKCPYCRGLEYVDEDGVAWHAFPPVGVTPIGVERESATTEECGCGWSTGFEMRWGVLPSRIETLITKE